MSVRNDDETIATAHVVVAKSPAQEESGMIPALYAVMADSPEQAEAAVQEVAPLDSKIEATGGPLSADTAERLNLKPGEAKQIG